VPEEECVLDESRSLELLSLSWSLPSFLAIPIQGQVKEREVAERLSPPGPKRRKNLQLVLVEQTEDFLPQPIYKFY
jgi:hypothetical protein